MTGARRSPGSRPGSGGWTDRGSGSVVLLAVVVLALTMALALAALVRVHAVRSSLRAAADLAALAAADSLAIPPGVVLAPDVRREPSGACALAEQVAGRNAADLTGCTAGPDGVVLVEVARGTPWGTARATARAGPAAARAP